MASDQAYPVVLADAERRALVDDEADLPLACVLETLAEAAPLLSPPRGEVPRLDYNPAMPRSPRPRTAARKRRPLVALLTDFGTRDHYAGAVRGAVLAACPEATVVDITHELPRHDVAAGAYSPAAAYRAFPPGAVFLAVVDPGVG